jgi:putative ABC transport system ATP-binding protein
MTSSAVIRCEALSKTYGKGDLAVHALRQVSLEVDAGELVMLRGSSGSGKTTLLNILGGLDTATSGEVWLESLAVTAANESELTELRRSHLGFIFQSFALLPAMSAAENIEIPLRLVDSSPRDRDARVAELLQLVGLAGHANQLPSELSGGQQQRVGIARALANRPRVLIADEPTGQLDSATAESMMSLIAGLVHDQGIAAIVSTHDPKMTAYADRVLELHDGELVDSRRTDRSANLSESRN